MASHVIGPSVYDIPGNLISISWYSESQGAPVLAIVLGPKSIPGSEIIGDLRLHTRCMQLWYNRTIGDLGLLWGDKDEQPFSLRYSRVSRFFFSRKRKNR